ncbi:Gfo/Idh/MocA family oxidoreductase [Paenibacillus sp.]|uniref:Gfo/Idh/MocA family protein n=1 Tax=Paenibacillus sp. TaxID=58172 RepID=UPI002D3393EB|nr:Gfo/Idh/MocA family oxidoreductase [Paenibacillus sp.]HZG87866.1 Gfo/Idh/MocA family oxidoreductase [Paenibacillus sp.]
MQVALIGAGEFAKTHLEAYRRNPNVTVSWICDPNLEAARNYADRYGIANVTANYEHALLDPAVSFVDITAPNYLHKPMAVRAMEAGKDVLCEKPMALNVQECLDMKLASERTGRKLFVKYHQRFDPVHRRVKAMIESGQFPDPVMAMFTLFGNHIPSMSDPNHWRGNPALCGGGCLFSSGSHVLDLIHSFFGKLKAVTAVARQLVVNNPDKGDDNATVTMEFESGVVVNFIGCWTTDRWTWSKEIHNRHGSLRVEQDENKSNLLLLTKSSATELLMEQPDWFNQSNYAAIDHFVDCMNDAAEPLYSLDECIESMRLLELAYMSSEQGRRIIRNEINEAEGKAV